MKISKATLTFIALLTTAATQASITYIDLDAAHLTQWDGTAYSTLTPGTGLGDWEEKVATGHGGNCWQNATRGSTDNADRLKTSVSGLADDTYDIYAYFWCDVSGWKLAAFLTDNVGGDLRLFNTRSTSTTDAGLSSFTETVIVAEVRRTLCQVYLGQVTGTGFMSI